jgi:hypothetical protein
VTDASFAELREGDVVLYVEETGGAGPVAVKVRVGGRRSEPADQDAQAAG